MVDHWDGKSRTNIFTATLAIEYDRHMSFHAVATEPRTDEKLTNIFSLLFNTSGMKLVATSVGPTTQVLNMDMHSSTLKRDRLSSLI